MLPGPWIGRIDFQVPVFDPPGQIVTAQNADAAVRMQGKLGKREVWFGSLK